MNRNKLFLILGAIAILILVGGGIFIYQYKIPNVNIKNQSETADWKTYKNDEYGFEFKYPQDWEVDGAYVNMVNQPSSFKISISPQKDSKDYAQFIAWGEYALDDTLEISKINNSSELQKIFKESYSWNEKGFSMKPIMIGGFNGFKTKASCSDGPACEVITYSFVKDNNAYQFQCTSDHQLKFEAILSTFKFTKN